MVAGVDSRWTVDSASYADGDLVVDVVRGEPHREADEVAIVRFSSGSNFEFTNRGRAIPIIPITPVG